MDGQSLDDGDEGGLEENGEGNNSEYSSYSYYYSSSSQEDDDDVGAARLSVVGMKFDSVDAARTFFIGYVKRAGLGSKVDQLTYTGYDGVATAHNFFCGKEGSKRRSASSCDAFLKIELRSSSDKWVATKFVKPSEWSSQSVHHHHLRPRRPPPPPCPLPPAPHGGGDSSGGYVHMPATDGNRGPHGVSHNARATRWHPYGLSERLNNSVTKCSPRRRRTLGKDARNLLEYFKKMQSENPGFFYAIQLDEDNSMTNVFWADARSRTAYAHFGDAIAVGGFHRVDRYKVPFAPFTGVNHHGQVILFGCAIVVDDSESSFVWILRSFLTSMNNRKPVSIVTGKSKSVQAAVSRVLPEVRHRIDKWDILREAQEELSRVCVVHPGLRQDLYSCINLAVTVDEFESSWNYMLEAYNLAGDEWLRSMYDARFQWVPAYFRDSFFAVLSPEQEFGCNSFLDGCVNFQTTLPMFFREYENALESWFEREVDADFDTASALPSLKTPSPMERQAADIYTKRIFAKFQEELVETFAHTADRVEEDHAAAGTFRVAKFDYDCRAYTVTLDGHETRASCSCQMFEFCGLPCRHILTVFAVTNVLTLPSRYFSKRWTKNAKCRTGVDEMHGEAGGPGSFVSRYNSICREAVKFAEEGAVTIEAYDAALTALREGAKGVAFSKKNISKALSPGSQVAATNFDEKRFSPPLDDTPLLWPRQGELARHINLNDSSGAPAQSVADLNLPRMAPILLQQDALPPGNMGVLPFLKSMTWVMENDDRTAGNVAIINLKLQYYAKPYSMESEVKIHLSKVMLKGMLKSMESISDQLSTQANRVAIINLKLQDMEISSGGSDIKFQVSKDTLNAMLRSMQYIHEQLLDVVVELRSDLSSKKQRKQ